MKNQRILVDREPLSKDFIKSKENFGHVLSQVKNLKPPVWKSPWFYGPVGLAVVAITVSAVNLNPTEHIEHQAQLERVLPIEKRKIEAQPVAMITPKEVELPSVREVIPKEVGNHLIPVVESIESTIEDVTEIAEFETEVEPVEEVVFEQKATYPNINGVYTGEINISTMRDYGITCGSNEIKSFSLQFYDGKKEVTQSIIGNKIPKDICDIIEDHNWGSMIFLTKVMGVNKEGEVFSLPSMNFIPH